MNTGTPLVDRDKSPLIDADHDPVRIADALRRSPHIANAQGEPGDDKIYFTTAAGAGFRLILRDGAPTGDDPLPAPDLTEAVAAAILNARDFVAAAPDSPRGGTITVQTRGGISYLLILDYCGTDSTAVDLPSPSAGIALAAGRLLTGSPSPFQRATGDLLAYIAATWATQDPPGARARPGDLPFTDPVAPASSQAGCGQACVCP